MKSALYEGSISHRRHAVEASGDVGHSFTYPTALALVYLDELDDLAHAGLTTVKGQTPRPRVVASP